MMTDQELKERKVKLEKEIALIAPGLQYEFKWEYETPVIYLQETVSPEMEKLLLPIVHVVFLNI